VIISILPESALLVFVVSHGVENALPVLLSPNEIGESGTRKTQL
jgi:hypothetical protein